MKGFWETVVVAFSLYSALPMPQIPWNKGNMGYAMAAFPLVGLVVGGAQVLWACLVPQMGFSTPWVAAAVAAILPVAVTGGIHLDGFCDVSDALASHASREKKLEIMKDSHAGAFALIVLGCYFVLTFALWAELYAAPSRQAEILVGLGYLLSRGMAACSVVSFPKAKDSGLLRTFSDSAQNEGYSCGGSPGRLWPLWVWLPSSRCRGGSPFCWQPFGFAIISTKAAGNSGGSPGIWPVGS